MLYSVWNPSALNYDYYQAVGGLKDGFATPPKLTSGHELGLTPEQATRPLPAGSVKVGSGDRAMGLIATTSGGQLGFLEFDSNTKKAALLIVCAFFLYKVTK